MEVNGRKMKHRNFHVNIRKTFFLTVRMVKYWNWFPRKGVESSAVKIFKSQTDLKDLFESKEAHKRIVLK